MKKVDRNRFGVLFFLVTLSIGGKALAYTGEGQKP